MNELIWVGQVWDSTVRSLPPGTVVLFWFTGTDEESVIERLKAELTPGIEFLE